MSLPVVGQTVIIHRPALPGGFLSATVVEILDAGTGRVRCDTLVPMPPGGPYTSTTKSSQQALPGTGGDQYEIAVPA